MYELLLMQSLTTLEDPNNTIVIKVIIMPRVPEVLKLPFAILICWGEGVQSSIAPRITSLCIGKWQHVLQALSR